MNENQTSKGNLEKSLRTFYESLPSSVFPKTEFVNEIVGRCHVSAATAHNWIKGKTRPNNPEHLSIISEITGIPQDKLWS